MQYSEALKLYNDSIEYKLPIDIILCMQGIEQKEYDDAIKNNNSKNTDVSFDKEFEDERYREYQEANFEEYFDWARTYRFCLWK